MQHTAAASSADMDAPESPTESCGSVQGLRASSGVPGVAKDVDAPQTHTAAPPTKRQPDEASGADATPRGDQHLAAAEVAATQDDVRSSGGTPPVWSSEMLADENSGGGDEADAALPSPQLSASGSRQSSSGSSGGDADGAGSSAPVLRPERCTSPEFGPPAAGSVVGAAASTSGLHKGAGEQLADTTTQAATNDRSSSSDGVCSLSSSDGTFEELRGLTAQLCTALTDSQTATRHAELLHRQVARMEHRRRQQPPLGQQQPAVEQLTSPPTAQSALRHAALMPGGDGNPLVHSFAFHPASHSSGNGGGGGGGGGGVDESAAATIAELTSAVGALSEELTAAAGQRMASASVLSGLLMEQGRFDASPADAPSSPAAAAAAARRTQRHMRAIASGLQVSSVAELGAARASEAIRRQALALQQELVELGHLPRSVSRSISPITALEVGEQQQQQQQQQQPVSPTEAGPAPSPPSSLRLTPGSSGSAPNDMRGSFAFGTPPSRDAAASGDGGGSVSVSFSGFNGGAGGGGGCSSSSTPQQVRKAARRRQRGLSRGSSASPSAADSSTPTISVEQEGSSSLVFATPTWLRRLSGRADATTQTSPAANEGRDAAARVQQLEGRLLLLQQRLQEAEVRAKISADARDALQTALIAAREQPQQQQQQQQHITPPVSPRQQQQYATPQMRELQERCVRQAARIEQLQLALAAATVGAVHHSTAAGAASPSPSHSGSLSVGSSGFHTPGRGSLTSTPSKSPAARTTPTDGSSGTMLKGRAMEVPIPLLPLHHLARQQQQQQLKGDEEEEEEEGIVGTRAPSPAAAAAAAAPALSSLVRAGSGTPDSSILTAPQLSPRSTRQQAVRSAAPTLLPRSSAPPLLSPRRTMPPSPRLQR